MGTSIPFSVSVNLTNPSTSCISRLLEGVFLLGTVHLKSSGLVHIVVYQIFFMAQKYSVVHWVLSVESCNSSTGEVEADGSQI